jgi:hypothetical protein
VIAIVDGVGIVGDDDGDGSGACTGRSSADRAPIVSLSYSSDSDSTSNSKESRSRNRRRQDNKVSSQVLKKSRCDGARSGWRGPTACITYRLVLRHDP